MAEVSLAISNAKSGDASNNEPSLAPHAMGGAGSFAEALLGISSSTNVGVTKESIPSKVQTTSMEVSDYNKVIIQDEDESISLGSHDTEPSKRDQEEEKGEGGKQWSSLFHNNRAPSSGLKLEYFPPTGEKLDFSHLKVPTLIEVWGYCLVGHFSGRFPGLKAIYAMTKAWEVEVQVKTHGKGWVIFKFLCEGDRTKVLTEGPYILYGKTMFLKELSEDFSTNSDEFLKVPTWVKFPRLSMRLWQANEIGRIASMVGVPITTDKVTQDKTYTSFARVLIEIDASKPPTLQFPIILPSGKEYVQTVLYETYPNFCCHCKKFGHHFFVCKVLNPPKGKVIEEVSTKGKTVGVTTEKEENFQVVTYKKKQPNAPLQGRLQTAYKLPVFPFVPKNVENVWGKKHVVDKDWDGRQVSSVHEMEVDDIVTKFVTKEDGLHLAFVKKRHQIESHASIVSIGRDLHREPRMDKPAICFTDSCLVSLPGVKRARRWYAFNKEIFILNVACFFDVNVRHNKDFLQAKKLPTESIIPSMALQSRGEGASSSKLPAPYTKAALLDPLTGEKVAQQVENPEGRRVRNMHDMFEDDVVTNMLKDENGKRVIFVKPLDDIAHDVKVVKVGPSLEWVPCDEPGVFFTEPCLISFLTVKKNKDWYDFDTLLFTNDVFDFFDANTSWNKKYLKEKQRRKRKAEREKEKGQIQPGDDGYTSDFYLT
ncbi:unnamed protein product [Cuscuta europaea]|uniref:DUF4283 domain-containing protein n=1 Tax=Cuscuta europaea TaxID=41803 RepID=A0A9P0Z322_CUSEU|nr:unnamed protein product [Cuscuta europaea]